MSYKIKPAGFSAPPKRREYKQKDNELEKRLGEWLNMVESKYNWDEKYSLAVEQISALPKCSLDEIYASVIAQRDSPLITKAGLWLSAWYNQREKNTIVYDLNLEGLLLDCIGYKLEKGKTLVNNGSSGNWMGEYANGIVMNNGSAGDGMGWHANGIIVNNGRAGNGMGSSANGIVVNNGSSGYWMGRGAKGIVVNNGHSGNRMGFDAKGIIVNNGSAGDWMGRYANKIIALKEPKSYGEFIGKRELFLKEEDCRKMPELAEYLSQIRDVYLGLKGASIEKIQEVVREWNQENIEKKINEIIRKAGLKI